MFDKIGSRLVPVVASAIRVTPLSKLYQNERYFIAKSFAERGGRAFSSFSLSRKTRLKDLCDTNLNWTQKERESDSELFLR